MRLRQREQKAMQREQSTQLLLLGTMRACIVPHCAPESVNLRPVIATNQKAPVGSLRRHNLHITARLLLLNPSRNCIPENKCMFSGFHCFCLLLSGAQMLPMKTRPLSLCVPHSNEGMCIHSRNFTNSAHVRLECCGYAVRIKRHVVARNLIHSILKCLSICRRMHTCTPKC